MHQGGEVVRSQEILGFKLGLEPLRSVRDDWIVLRMIDDENTRDGSLHDLHQNVASKLSSKILGYEKT